MFRVKNVLPIIVLSQFLCTSLWFAGNGVMNDLTLEFNLNENVLGHLTSAVQFGFITGTLLFAVLTLSDRYSPSLLFLLSAIAGAACNLGIVLEGNELYSLLGFRFFTGFFLAGIYPVGMKIAADYYDKGLGKSLGYLVGALVLGTAFPHLLKDFTSSFPWRWVVLTTSACATFGGLLLFLLVGNGPFRKKGEKLDLLALFRVFRYKEFRSPAFGYFGHMWELYAFWAFVPLMLTTYTNIYPQVDFNVPLISFLIIGIGSISCVVGGYLSQYFGVKKTAASALFISGLCCLVSPFMFQVNSSILFIGFLVFWGIMVVADSPLFSTMVAQNAPDESKGTALTIVNCIGFSITIISIQVITVLSGYMATPIVFLFLVLGPVLGLIAMYWTKLKIN